MKSYEIQNLKADDIITVKEDKKTDITSYLVSYGLMIAIPIIKEINELVRNNVR